VTDVAIADTGFWIALFDPRDQNHASARARADWIELATLIVPWPILYETLRTRFVQRRDWLTRLNGRLKKPNVEFIDDANYRDEAYALTVEYATRQRPRPISMVDMLCRLLIADPSIRVEYLLTTNPRDYLDVCRTRNVELI
jgi:predicted nucleic acid-binding protein